MRLNLFLQREEPIIAVVYEQVHTASYIARVHTASYIARDSYECNSIGQEVCATAKFLPVSVLRDHEELSKIDYKNSFKASSYRAFIFNC